MAELEAPLLSLRDSLHALFDRSENLRVARAILKVNTLLASLNPGTAVDIGPLRAFTERVAATQTKADSAFDELFDELEAFLARL